MITKLFFVLNVWLNESTVLKFFYLFRKNNLKVKLESSSFEVSFLSIKTEIFKAESLFRLWSGSTLIQNNS
jgi:hypothetical protein